MFRDLKEYQEIAKIYAEKVSKPENLEERRGSSSTQLAQNRDDAFKGVPNSASNKRAEASIKRRGDKKFVFNKPTGGTNRRAEMSIKRRDQNNSSVVANKSDVVPGTRVNEIGAEGGGKPSSGDLSMFKDKKPEVSTMTKQGKPRTKAQMMAAKRIASGKTIDDVKAENQAAMKARAKAKFEAFKKRRAEKRAGMSEGVAALKLGGMIAPKVPGALKAISAGAATGATVLGIKKKAEEGRPAKRRKQTKTIDQVKADNETRKQKEREESARQRFIKKDQEYDNMAQAQYETDLEDAKNSAAAQKMEADKIKKARQAFRTGTKQESYEPYDIVLEYLLSTEQAATIEEANYVMTEMDAKTIQDIVAINGEN